MNDSKPPIWRRILVPDSVTLHQFHTILQIVMGWTNSHLHQFIIDDEYYSDPEDSDYGDIKNEKRYRLNQFVERKGFKFIYEYDFGDSWEHTVHVEAILPFDPSTGSGRTQYPICVEGKRACPPEDIGGVWGYEELLKAASDPNHPDYNEILIEWFEEDFDPERFDIEDINLGLRHFASRARMMK